VYILSALAMLFFILFAIREYSAFKRKLTFKYFFSPMVIVSVIFIVIFSIALKGPSVYSILVLFALIFALIADTLLMIEEVSFLKNGLIFFLISHLFYVYAFMDGYIFEKWHLALAFSLLLVNIFHVKLIRKGAGKLIVPVVFYIIVLDLMGFFAITKLNNGSGLFELLLALGAVMFLVSDFILSIDAFVKKINHSTVYTWLFYAPAQFLFALSTMH
jgi:uncharacterized membrane protein YhhN